MSARTKRASAAGRERATESADEQQRLSAIFMARVPAEDLEPYSPEALERAVSLAHAALRRHRKGGSLIDIDTSGKVLREGRPVTVFTFVNDNMPFLFDSIMGEITASVSEPLLVLHPVIYVRHDRGGVSEILGESGPAKGAEEADRVSLIQVHTPSISGERVAALRERLEKVLSHVRVAVGDWKRMLARLDEAISMFRYMPVPLKRELVEEAVAFLEWLRDDNFTFLGMRDYHYSGGAKTGTLERSRKPGLGILSDPDFRVLRSGAQAVTTTPEIRAFLHGPEPLIVTKANTKSLVHRRAYLDYIGVKSFDQKGKLAGELRILGLFTSTAYTRSVLRIPYLRAKAQAVIAKSGFSPTDHSGKALINVLESYPRDELFQIPVALLRKHAEAILALGERPRVRVLFRVDQFDRFVSVIVFVPRDRYDSHVRERIGDYLKTVFEGRLSAFYPAFPEGTLARVHFIIGRNGGRTPKVEAREIEAAIREIVRTWEDALQEAAEASGADQSLVSIAARFPESYRRSFSAGEALLDARRIAGISADRPLDIDFRRRGSQEDGRQVSLLIYHHGTPMALSERVPLLENMGFRVISERTFEVMMDGSAPIHVHDMTLESAFGGAIDLEDGGRRFAEVFTAVWRGDSDNDAYNGLVQTAGLANHEIGILRAYGRYLQQAGIPQSQDFVAGVLNRYPAIARSLYELFVCRHDPARAERSHARQAALRSEIEAGLDQVPNLDDDTIIRRLLSIVEATVRTNHFAPPPPDGLTRSLAFKLDPRRIDGLPEPRPWREIFVYGAEVEGVHLRFGPVARGGLRWSDRAQDYRTEVLGLVKAQQIKNAVIVPVGAKGGFYPKRLPAGGSREAVFEAGRAAYVNFVSSLLSLTDNLDGGTVVPPPGIVRHDADDPYFVVAADKGTATFSDTANEISQKYGFWLDDAFASGGSAGYDHKKMGITARGAWEAVKRHFREMNRDIQNEPFTVAGVGDMSGDVFGNGMLLSRQIRLLAAFDHRDIFIDPAPDPEVSFSERERLFRLPRSSWQDYDRARISKGGGVFSRSLKSITLSQEAAAAIGLAKTTATPIEIMSAILKAPVDLLWFGGIGTYVRASAESNSDVGDRANDAIRVTALEVRARVIGEGANLAVTQRGRIEYGLAGGRCNSDAIDNSGGVNSSDLEVNIKIALAGAMRERLLARPQRNRLLADMTEEVAGLVLRNNYEQTLAISLSRRRGLTELGDHSRFISEMENRGLLSRTVEALPTERALDERAKRGEPLTRAEIGVLVAYAKIVLFDELLAGGVPDDPHMEADLFGYFPARLARKFAGQIRSHRLRREIIATELSNDLVNRCGPAFITRLQDETGASAGDIAAAYTTVRDGFELPALIKEIDRLDSRIDGMVQLDFYLAVRGLIESASAWHIKNDNETRSIAERCERLRRNRQALESRLLELVPPFMRQRHEERTHAFFKSGAPEALAGRLAFLEIADLIPDIGLVAANAEVDPPSAARAFFAITETFRLGRIEAAARAMTPADYFDGLALSRATDMISRARRDLAIAALTRHRGASDPVEAWLHAGGARVARARERLLALAENSDISLSRLAVASGLMADLASL